MVVNEKMGVKMGVDLPRGGFHTSSVYNLQIM